MKFNFIILAAGKSKRYNSNLSKVYHKIGNKSLIEMSLDKAKKFREIKKIVIVYNKKDKTKIKNLNLKNVDIIVGGKTRQESTMNALRYLKKKSKFSGVLIHDAARPNFSIKLLRNILHKMKGSRAVIPKIGFQDALKEIQESSLHEYIISKNRDNLFLTQTPQCFILKEVFRYHELNKDKYKDDDMSLYMDLNKIKFIEGEKNNFKVTDKKDFENLKKLYISKVSYGIGFDVHRLVSKRKLYLGGLKIKSKVGTLGHSDGDPVLHSIIDSLLGACSLGDIGQLFSDKSKKFKNIRSTILLKEVLNMLRTKNFYINNIDINIITEYPKIKKLRYKIIKNISMLCDVPMFKISLKGKTTEKLGIIGKEKAIACETISSLTQYD